MTGAGMEPTADAGMESASGAGAGPMSGDGVETLRLTFGLNGRPVSLQIDARDLLAEVLRDRLGLTGTKVSCDLQVCGACTVLVDGQPVSACSYLAYEVRGRQVETIEGLARDGRLHPLQRAFVEHGALQCGFCTPGMILSARALLAETPHPTREEMAAYLEGNICRCTGYARILDAIEAVAAGESSPGEAAPSQAAPTEPGRPEWRRAGEPEARGPSAAEAGGSSGAGAAEAAHP